MADFRRMLQARPCFGTFLKLPRPEIVDILALAGFAFVICDMEHAQISEPEARSVIRACTAADLPCLVRLPDPAAGLVNRLLEAGAAGIQMPRLQTAAQTTALHQMMRFPPAGTRSVGVANPLAGYGTLPVASYLQQADASSLVVGQFETRQIDEPCDPMMDGLDVAFIGPVDLAVDYGAVGESGHADVTRHVQAVEAAAARTGTTMGAFAGDTGAARRYLEAGYRYLAVAGDVTFVAGAARSCVSQLRECLAEVTATANPED
jgi:2-keto-3-deoxy-L-rhamnonate aldolase RhmA